jgi:hypothetical protein
MILRNTSAAADGNALVVHLPGNARTMTSGIGVKYLDG